MIKTGFSLLLLVLMVIGGFQKARDAKRWFRKMLSRLSIRDATKTQNWNIRLHLSILTATVVPLYIKKQFWVICSLFICIGGLGINQVIYARFPEFDYIFVVAAGYVLIKGCTFFISSNNKWELAVGAVYAIAFLLLLDYVFIKGMSNFAVKGVLRFRVIFLMILMLFIPFFFSMKKIIDSSNSTQLIGTVAFLTFSIPVLSTLLLFGIYNLSHPETLPGSQNATANLEILKQFYQTDDLHLYLKVVLFGAQNVFQLPGVALSSSGIPIVQYLFGMTLILLVIAIFVSYASASISELRQKKQGSSTQ